MATSSNAALLAWVALFYGVGGEEQSSAVVPRCSVFSSIRCLQSQQRPCCPSRGCVDLTLMGEWKPGYSRLLGLCWASVCPQPPLPLCAWIVGCSEDVTADVGPGGSNPAGSEDGCHRCCWGQLVQKSLVSPPPSVIWV